MPPPDGPQAALAEDEAPTPGVESKRKSTRRNVIEWVVTIAAVILIAFLIKTFLVEPFSIPSGSMEPTLKNGDRILVSKISYDLHGIHTGDIVVFDAPPALQGDGHVVKRVIGLPGQTIWSGTQGQIYINGKLLNQPWLTPQARANPGPAITKQTIPSGQYFVMGDNRDDSEDSRMIGDIPRKLIVGKVVVLVWPLSRLHFF